MVERRPAIQEFLSSSEFTLSKGVLFIQGASRGALYDLSTGRVFSLNQASCDILVYGRDNENFWGRLEAAGLAVRGATERKSMLSELLQEPELQFVWFEILSDDCNESCVHCYADSMPPAYRKARGIPGSPTTHTEQSQPQRTKLSTEKWMKLIEDAYTLGCRRCQFIGGEPFLWRGHNGQNVLDLARRAKDTGYEFIEIYTNATLLTPAHVARIKELGLHMAVSLYSDVQEIHERITNTPGSFRLTMRGLELLRESGIPTRVETVLMRHNEHTIEQTQKFVEQMGFQHHPPDVLRPKGRGDKPGLLPTKETVVKYSLLTAPNFRADKETVSRYMSGHSCLLGKITITDTGDVLPCIFSRTLSVGNVQESTLQEIIVGQKLDVVWRNTKDQVLVCQDCEYRYVCFDCRPLSEGANQGKGEYLTVPYPRCTYNPYTGKWAGGVWRVNEEGEPYYDETLAPVIKEIMTSGEIKTTGPVVH